MTTYTTTKDPLMWVEARPTDVRNLSESERDALIIKTLLVDGHWVVACRYGDPIWLLDGFTSNTPDSEKCVDFSRLPTPFQLIMKAIFYRYLRRGRIGQKRPTGSTLRGLFKATIPFLRHLHSIKINNFSSVTPTVCASYVEACRVHHRKTRGNMSKPISPSYLMKRFAAVEALYELSQYTSDKMKQHPWEDTSAAAMAGVAGRNSPRKQESKTPLIPDEEFCALFEKAFQLVDSGSSLLDLRDKLSIAVAGWRGRPPGTILHAKNRLLVANGWNRGLAMFKEEIVSLRTACYIVLASVSGCRNHELANLQSGAHHRTEDDEGTIYHWMRSKSEKTDAGDRSWMIPDAGVRALRVIERWAEPYQNMVAAELAKLRRNNPNDPEITKVQQHLHTLFLGMDPKRSNQVRTLSNRRWNTSLLIFAKKCGLKLELASHQFRRKFANYVAHSRFGDLRYLREHFAHWGMDTTLSYAMDQGWGQHLDMELYDDIQTEVEDIKLKVVDSWLGDDPLSGGFGRSIKHWRRDPVNLAIFKSHSSMVRSIAETTAIRSNGHAWCTADNNDCVGNTFDATRCGGCDHAVIGRTHANFYQGLYDNLNVLLDCRDIGDSGLARVKRDLKHCREVFVQLGYDPIRSPI
ncbi:integrase [Pseudomonas sp. JAI115]|uniref:integrase n=1 Tax=Pseudomonas sp. JAI115 TaxID=2723061 RepID=UPI0016165927|nr:integrase [Pseudomonas sp. JAI115]MBB6157642.1 integrase [Pseudomonas sp. JAI115]